MSEAVIFDVDGTLIDSVDLHARAWQEAFATFGRQIAFQEIRHQIGKGGDQLIPFFLSKKDLDDYGSDLESWRGRHFKAQYLPLIRPFSAVPELLNRVRLEGLKIGIASSAKKDELDSYLAVARVTKLIDVSVSGEEVEQSKPHPDVFQMALNKLGTEAAKVVAVGDTPYDAEAAAKVGVRTIGFLSGGFREDDLRESGCIAVYPGPSSLLACFADSPLAVAPRNPSV